MTFNFKGCANLTCQTNDCEISSNWLPDFCLMNIIRDKMTETKLPYSQATQPGSCRTEAA